MAAVFLGVGLSGHADSARPPAGPTKKKKEVKTSSGEQATGYQLRKGEVFSPDVKPKIGNLLTHKFDDGEFKARLKLASRALDEWAQRVEEYGSVTMSSPILTSEQAGFKFDVKEGAQEFFNNAKKRKDASAAATLAIVHQLSFAGDVSLDSIAKAQLTTSLTNFNNEQRTYEEQLRANDDAVLADRLAAAVVRDDELKKARAVGNEANRAAQEAAAYSKYATAVRSSPLTKPTFPAEVAGSGFTDPNATRDVASTAKTNLDAPNGSENSFLDLISRLGADTPLKQLDPPGELPDRVALIDAAGTNTVKGIFQLLGNPTEAMKFQDKTVFFATVTVAANPGWRTRKDFSAEISGQASYRLTQARPEIVLAFADRLTDNLCLSERDELLKNHGVKAEFDLREAKKNKDKKADPKEAELAKVQALLKDNEQQAELLKKQADQLQKQVAELEDQKKSLDTTIPYFAEKARTEAKVAAQRAPTLSQIYAQPASVLERERLNSEPAARPMLKSPQDITKKIQDEIVKEDTTQLTKADTLIQEAVKLDAAGDSKAAAEILTPLAVKSWAIKSAEKVAAAPQVPEIANELPENVFRLQQAIDFKEKANTKLSGLMEQAAVVNDQQSRTSSARPPLEESKTQLETQIAKKKTGAGGGASGSAFAQGNPGGDVGGLPFFCKYFNQVSLEKQAPLVAGISPLMETQVMDLKDSYGRQDQIAIALAVALRQSGQKNSAQLFDRYMRRQTKTAASLSSLPVVNTFSASGGLFGFQVGPRLRALEDPAARKGGSANVLDRQSFPAVLIIGVDRADLCPVICKGYDNKFYIFEPQLVIRQTSRWNPLDGKLFTPFKDPWWNPLSWHNPRYSERDRIDNLLSVADHFRDLDRWLLLEDSHTFSIENGDRDRSEGPASNGSGKDGKCVLPLGCDPEINLADAWQRHPYATAVQSLLRRRDALMELSVGSESRQYMPISLILPAPPAEEAKPVKEPRVADVVPPSIMVPGPGGPQPKNTAALAQAQAAFNAQVTQASVQRGFAQTAVDNAAKGIKDSVQSEATLKALVTANLSDEEKKKPENFTPAILKEYRELLLSLAGPVDQLGAALTAVKETSDSLVSAVGQPTEKALAAMDSLAEILRDRQATLKTKAQAIPDVTTAQSLILQTVKIERKSLVEFGSNTADEVRLLAERGMAFKALLQPQPVFLSRVIVILGENLEEITQISASEDDSVLKFAQIGQTASANGEVSTEIVKNSIVMRLTPLQSAVVHFRITFQLKNPQDPTKPITRILYTPPVTFQLGDVAPTASGKGYFPK